MNASDATATRAIVASLWPRTSSGRFAWTAMEWSTFIESCGRLSISTDQADAALRNLKATSEKYPSVAGLLKAMKSASPECAEQPSVSEPTLTRADFMRKLLAASGIVVDGGDAEVLRAYWLDGLHATMRMRGDVPPHYRDDFKADAAACHVGQTEADDVWDWLVGQVVDIELDEPANKMWKGGVALREMMGRADSNTRGDGKLMPKSRPKSRNAQKRDWIARRIQIHEVIAAQEVA